MTARTDRVPPFHAMAMSRSAWEMAASGRPVIHLEIGQPATGAPQRSIDAVRDALGGPLGYTNAPGLPSLLRRISRHYADSHGVDVDTDRIVAVAGASAGFTLAFLAAFEPGARIGVIEPGYPCYRNTLHALDMEPVPVVVGPQTRWAPTPALLDEVVAAGGALDGLVVASPSNPTGTVLLPEALADLTSWCERNGTRLVADEIYHGIVYDTPDRSGPAATALAATRQAVVVNSFSKYYSMTGWRIGWMVVPDDLIDAVERLQQNLYICAPHVSQIAATAAFDATEELDRHVERYAANRRMLLDGLAAAGIDRVADADGAFYVYADVGDLLDLRPDIPDTMALCRRWLDDLGVATTPGVDFDLVRGGRFVRFSYAGGGDDIGAACELLAGWLR